MISIGITGGVGSGKSEVIRYINDKYKARVILADEAAHLLEAKGQACYNKLVKAFGNEILGEDGEIDKLSFAKVIFGSNDNLAMANSIIHPAVKEYITAEMENERKAGSRLFVLEAALLIEEGYKEILDELWYVHTNEGLRYERLSESRGYTNEKTQGIIKNQLKEEEFFRQCDRVIENNGSIEELHRNIDIIFGSLNLCD